tara:strand:+ start:129 stop:422 length:294 start_codon:yes stop_codon:yes gene_type:complete
MKKIIYTALESKDGVLAVLTPSIQFLEQLEGTEEEKLIHLANKELPTGTKYEIIGDDIDLSDRTFRNAWEYETGANEKVSQNLTEEDLKKYNMKENK